MMSPKSSNPMMLLPATTQTQLWVTRRIASSVAAVGPQHSTANSTSNISDSKHHCISDSQPRDLLISMLARGVYRSRSSRDRENKMALQDYVSD